MKYLKQFESFENSSILDELSDLFIEIEDLGYTVKARLGQIVPDRNDWTGNFQSTKVRNVWGNEFIDYTKDVIMSKDDRKWNVIDAHIVNISKINYLKP